MKHCGCVLKSASGRDATFCAPCCVLFQSHYTLSRVYCVALLSLQVFSTIDAAIDKFKRQPINPETQQALPSHPQAAYQYPVTNAAAYSDTSYPAAAAPAQYTGAPYDASAYAAGQYAAYPQQQYQQAYAPTGSAAAANVPGASQGTGQLEVLVAGADSVSQAAWRAAASSVSHVQILRLRVLSKHRNLFCSFLLCLQVLQVRLAVCLCC